jgi:hypothetical protein
LVLVDPGLAAWDGEEPPEWRGFLPNIPEDHRDTRSAEEFMDALLRAYLVHPRQLAKDAVGRMDDNHPQRVGVEALIDALEARDSVWVLRWIRAASRLGIPGESIAMSAQLTKGLLGVGSLLGASTVIGLRPEGWVIARTEMVVADPPSPDSGRPETTTIPVMLLMVPDNTLGSVAASEARTRVIRARGVDLVPAGVDVVVVVVGHIGPISGELGVRRGDRLDDLLFDPSQLAQGLPDSIVFSAPADHLIDGTSSGSIVLINGETLIEAV